MKTHKFAIREIIKACEELGQPMTENDKKALEELSVFQLTQELQIIREILDVRQRRELLRMTQELTELQKAQFMKEGE
jgi:PII-like signaling protein